MAVIIRQSMNVMRPFWRDDLEQAFEEAKPGSVYVISHYRNKSANLRTQFLKIIQQAGLKPWGKPWQNLRSTRETELLNDFPIQVVCEWIGNSQPVAAKHYLQITEEHFEQTLQKPVQQAPEMQRKESYTMNTGQKESPDLQGFADSYEDLQCTEVVPIGLEPTTSCMSMIP